MAKVMFRTWEETTYTDGTKNWRTTGYARRPHLPIVNETKASWFFEKPNGQKVKVSKTDRIKVWGQDGEYWEKI